MEQLSLSSAAWVICRLTQAKQRIEKKVLMGLGTKGSNEDLRDSRIKEKGLKVESFIFISILIKRVRLRFGFAFVSVWL